MYYVRIIGLMNCRLHHITSLSSLQRHVTRVLSSDLALQGEEKHRKVDLSFSRGTFYLSVDKLLFGVGELMDLGAMYLYLLVDIGGL